MMAKPLMFIERDASPPVSCPAFSLASRLRAQAPADSRHAVAPESVCRLATAKTRRRFTPASSRRPSIAQSINVTRCRASAVSISYTSYRNYLEQHRHRHHTATRLTADDFAYFPGASILPEDAGAIRLKAMPAMMHSLTRRVIALSLGYENSLLPCILTASLVASSSSLNASHF